MQELVTPLSRSFLGGRRAPLRPFLRTRALAAGALALGFASSVDAQAPTLFVSAAQDLAAGGGLAAVDDSTLVLVAPGGPRLQFAEEHWLGVAGRVPGDVDGLARRPGAPPGSHRELLFTLQADEAGFLDGDVLGLAVNGGFEVVVAEADVQLALGVPGTGIDLDALAYDDQGRLLFSLQADLPGSALGDLDDGDVLRLEADGTATRVFSEADVQAAVTFATGSTSAIGDVLALEFVGGEVWVGVQSPSATDGAVLSLGAVPAVVLDEAGVALGGAELDGMMWADPAAHLGRIDFSTHAASPGDVVTLEFAGGAPGHPLMVLLAGNAGYADTTGVLEGFDALFIDLADPFFNALAPVPIVMLDAGGGLSRSVELPIGNFGGAGFEGEPGWTFQTIDLFTFEVSAPARIGL